MHCPLLNVTRDELDSGAPQGCDTPPGELPTTVSLLGGFLEALKQF